MRLPAMMTACALAALASSPVSAQSRGGPEIPLSDYLGILHTVEATVAGQTGAFLFDTGGGVSVVTVEFAERIGCTPWGDLANEKLWARPVPEVSRPAVP